MHGGSIMKGNLPDIQIGQPILRVIRSFEDIIKSLSVIFEYGTFLDVVSLLDKMEA